MDASRNGNGYSALRLTYSDVDAWARLRRVTLAGWELSALRKMDDIRVALLNDRAAAPAEEPTAAQRKMTPKLFAALFSK